MTGAPSPPVVTKRPLTADEVEVLAREVRSTAEVTGYSPSEWRRLGPVWVAEVNGRLAGFCASDEIGADWAELGLIYVLRPYRGLGIGRALFEACFDDLARQRRVFIATANPAVASLMRERGMDLVGFWRLPRPLLWKSVRSALHPRRLSEFLRKRLRHRLPYPVVYGITRAPVRVDPT